MIPPEILKWADMPTIALVIFASQILRPIVAKVRWIRKDPDRIILLPLLLGFVIGCAVEMTTPKFDAWMAIRRVLVDGFAAAGLFRAGKIATRRNGKNVAGAP